MKTLIVFTILCIVACSGVENECSCAVFFKGRVTEKDIIHEFELKNVPCAACKGRCNEVASQATGGGDLGHYGTSTHEHVRDIACRAFTGHINDGLLCAYSKCESGWEEGECATEHLCCNNGRVCHKP